MYYMIATLSDLILHMTLYYTFQLFTLDTMVTSIWSQVLEFYPGLQTWLVVFVHGNTNTRNM